MVHGPNQVVRWRPYLKQELRAHMALVTKQEELQAKRSFGISYNKILRINRLIYKENQRLSTGQDLK